MRKYSVEIERQSINVSYFTISAALSWVAGYSLFCVGRIMRDYWMADLTRTLVRSNEGSSILSMVIKVLIINIMVFTVTAPFVGLWFIWKLGKARDAIVKGISGLRYPWKSLSSHIVISTIFAGSCAVLLLLFGDQDLVLRFAFAGFFGVLHGLFQSWYLRIF